MKKALAISVIITGLAAMGYFTKPTEEACVEKAITVYLEQRLSYAAEKLPSNINADIFKKTAEQAFIENLKVVDHFIYRGIYTQDDERKGKIGWGAFGFVTVEIK